MGKKGGVGGGAFHLPRRCYVQIPIGSHIDLKIRVLVTDELENCHLVNIP